MRLFAAVLSLLAMLLQPSTSLAAGDGVIEGQLQNATANGAVPANLPIVLHAVGDNERVDRFEGTVGADGRYRFEGLETTPNLKYLPIVEYQGAMYFPRPVTLNEQPHQTADITVYESTESDQWLAFERSNLLIQNVEADHLEIMEMGAVANVGDRTYLGPGVVPGAPKYTLRFTLPSGANTVEPQFGFAPNDFAPTPDGFAVQSPIVPGRHQLAFSYNLPTPNERLDVQKRVEYPTRSFNLYVPDVGLRVDSPHLKPQGQAEFGGQKFLLYTAENLPRGVDLRLQISGLPAGGTSSTQLSWAMLGIGCGLLAAGILAVYRRRLAPAPAGLTLAGAPVRVSTNGHGQTGEEQRELERMQLLLMLARLDERYERGELPREQYEREREDGKRRLVGLGEQRIGAEAVGE